MKNKLGRRRGWFFEEHSGVCRKTTVFNLQSEMVYAAAVWLVNSLSYAFRDNISQARKILRSLMEEHIEVDMMQCM